MGKNGEELLAKAERFRRRLKRYLTWIDNKEKNNGNVFSSDGYVDNFRSTPCAAGTDIDSSRTPTAPLAD